MFRSLGVPRVSMFSIIAVPALLIVAPVWAEKIPSQVAPPLRNAGSQTERQATAPNRHAAPEKGHAISEFDREVARRRCGAIAPDMLMDDPFFAELRSFCVSFTLFTTARETKTPLESTIDDRLAAYSHILFERAVVMEQDTDEHGNSKLIAVGRRDVSRSSRFLIARELRLTNILEAHRETGARRASVSAVQSQSEPAIR